MSKQLMQYTKRKLLGLTKKLEVWLRTIKRNPVDKTIFNPYFGCAVALRVTVDKNGVHKVNQKTREDIHRGYNKCFDSDWNLIDKDSEFYWNRLSEVLLEYTNEVNIGCCGVPKCEICGDKELRKFKIVGKRVLVLTSNEKRKILNGWWKKIRSGN